MKADIQTTSPRRGIRLWQVILAIAVVSLGLGLLPERIGLPLFLALEGALIIALLFFVAAAIYRRVAKK
jgi:heme A synthase